MGVAVQRLPPFAFWLLLSVPPPKPAAAQGQGARAWFSPLFAHAFAGLTPCPMKASSLGLPVRSSTHRGHARGVVELALPSFLLSRSLPFSDPGALLPSHRGKALDKN